MKACVLLTLLALCCPLAVMADDLEFDDGAMLGAMIVGSMMGNCAEYGRECNNMRCCQYMGYSEMACRNGQCLQKQCGSYGMRCNAFNHCCYHESLTCFLATGRCGYLDMNGKK